MSDMTLWGFDGSTYVRTVKMLLAEKGCHAVQAGAAERAGRGSPNSPSICERHPFGKVPVLDHDGMRILETAAIARYLNDILPGKSLVPATPKDRARMDMIVGIVDSYGYGALIGGVAAYHLFPDFVGGKNDAMRKGGLENGRKAIELAMQTKGSSPFIAGELQPGRPLSRADHLLCVADAGQGRRVRCRRLRRLVGQDPGPAKLQGHTAEPRLTKRGLLHVRRSAEQTWSRRQRLKLLRAALGQRRPQAVRGDAGIFRSGELNPRVPVSQPCDLRLADTAL